jgi:hypothetical protein
MAPRITPDTPQRGASQNLLRVIDSYYRPARDRVGEAAMSQGFRDVSNFFGNEAAKAKKEQLEQIQIKAQQDAMAGLDPDQELSEVRNGFLFRSNSKAYNQAYNETMGKKAAIEFKEQATLEYEKSGLKYSTDPNRFREWMNKKVTGFLKDPEHNNPYFLAGAMPYVQQTTFNMSAAHTGNISRQMEANHLAAIQKQADDIAMSIATGEMSIEDGLGALTKLNGQAYGTGFSGPKSRAALLTSFLTVADATDNMEMIDALLEAQKSGDLKLTPKEWNAVVNQSQGIQRDIQFREAQKERAAKAAREQEEAMVTDVVADFYNNPQNAAVPFSTFLQTPVGDSGQTMADMINGSANTAALMTKAKTAYETINTIYDIAKPVELGNNYAITEAFDNGEITDMASMMSWFQTAQKDGLQFNDKNWEHAYGQLEKFGDDEQPYKTQTYKDYKTPALNRIIGALTPDDNALSFSFEGEYQGGMSDDIKIRFQSYLDEALGAIPEASQKNPELIRKAIELAEQQTMDFYKQNDPSLFNKQFESFTDAVNKGTVSWTSNPYFAQEAARLAEEQAAAVAEQTLNMEAARSSETVPFGRTDLDIQKGASVLGLTVDENNTDTSVDYNKMLVDANAFIQNLNEATINEQSIPVIAQEMFDKFNITIPRNAEEYGYFKDDIAALQEESGISITPEVMREIEAYFDKLYGL